MLVKSRAGDNFAAMQREEFEQRIFPGGERHRIATARDSARRGIDYQVADLDHIARLAGRPTNERAQAGQQLRQVKRFDDIIIRAIIESAYAIARRVARREHEDRGFLRAADLLQKSPSIDPGEHTV